MYISEQCVCDVSSSSILDSAILYALLCLYIAATPKDCCFVYLYIFVNTHVLKKKIMCVFFLHQNSANYQQEADKRASMNAAVPKNRSRLKLKGHLLTEVHRNERKV